MKPFTEKLVKLEVYVTEKEYALLQTIKGDVQTLLSEEVSNFINVNSVRPLVIDQEYSIFELEKKKLLEVGQTFIVLNLQSIVPVGKAIVVSEIDSDGEGIFGTFGSLSNLTTLVYLGKNIPLKNFTASVNLS